MSTTTSPVFTPVRMPTRTPQRRSRSSLSALSARRIASAARTARNASSSRTTGVPHTAITASPMNLATLPPCASIAPRISA